MNSFLITLKNWSGYAAAITLMSFLIYIVGQQSFRQSANSPQYEMARDAAKALDKGADPKSLIPVGPAVEMSESLSPYLVIYDAAGNMVAGNVTLNGKPLKIPQVAIDYVPKHGKDVVTWEPQPSVRHAMVGFSTANKAYVVVAGRSLDVTEERIALLGEQVLFGWAMSLIAILVVVVLQQMVAKRLEQRLVKL